TAPTSRRTRRCFETCGCARPSRSTRSFTGRSPPARASRICRRRGSATALNASVVVAARAMRQDHIPIWEYVNGARASVCGQFVTPPFQCLAPALTPGDRGRQVRWRADAAADASTRAMTLTQYYTATSLDGFIAGADNSLDWLFTRQQ